MGIFTDHRFEVIEKEEGLHVLYLVVRILVFRWRFWLGKEDVDTMIEELQEFQEVAEWIEPEDYELQHKINHLGKKKRITEKQR